MPPQTPSQTVGPFFSHALTPAGSRPGRVPGNRIADEAAPGVPIRIEGRLLDGVGDPVPDGMVEIWQADDEGVYGRIAEGFHGFGRAGTDPDGRFTFLTIKPGPVAQGMAPHASVAVFARGMLNHAFTRIYFSDEAAANAADPVLSSVEPTRRGTLVATRSDRDGIQSYEFTIRLQGDRESVFFDA